MKINLRKISYFFLFISIIPITAGFFLYISKRNFLNNAILTEASVIKLEPSTTYEGKQLYSPVLQFEDSKGNIFRENARISTGEEEFQIGEKIEIYYNPLNPKNLLLNIFPAK